MNKPVLLTILDGVGISHNKKGNAAKATYMPFMAYARTHFSATQLKAAEEAVGLPAGQMGNSEVGHLHIGAGRIKHESLEEINDAIASHAFAKNPAFKQAIQFCRDHHSNFHITGLFSDGGVHAHMHHMIATYQLLKKQKFPYQIFFHLIGDGRDTAPAVFHTFLKQLIRIIGNDKHTHIATISGRYYTMDRDKRFDRILLGFNAIVNGEGDSFTDPYRYVVQDQYQDKKINDEFLLPAYNEAINYQGVADHDVLFFANFRPDRAVQFTSALSNPDYLFYPQRKSNKIYLLTMKKYGASVHETDVCFRQTKLKNTLGKWISLHGKKQLRIAETEKIAHVTFFFDGGYDYFQNGLAPPHEISLKHADCILIPSLKVATYDLQPQMSAYEITLELIKNLQDHCQYDLIVLNFANGDMVGHTGYYEATKCACRTIDHCLQMIYETITQTGGTMLITADHGNCEVMTDANGQPNKKHTLNKVDFIICDNKHNLQQNGDIGLSNVAPTVLELMKIDPPQEMTRRSLIVKQKNSATK